MANRISIDSYMMNLARLAAARATCPRRSVGAVLVAKGKVISTGYNGAPPGMQHCFGEGCKNASGNCVNTIHAETNCIISATKKGDTLYCTDKPCASCLKTALAHNPEIRIVWWRHYPDLDRDQFVGLHGIEKQLEQVTIFINKEMLEYLPPMPDERQP